MPVVQVFADLLFHVGKGISQTFDLIVGVDFKFLEVIGIRQTVGLVGNVVLGGKIHVFDWLNNFFLNMSADDQEYSQGQSCQ